MEPIFPLSGISKGQGTEKSEGTGESARLRQAVKDFESLFLYEMLKEMRKVAGSGSLWGKGLGDDIYGSLFDMELAKAMAQRGTGLGDLILKQVERRLSGIPSDSGENAAMVEKGEPLLPQRGERLFPKSDHDPVKE